MDGNSGVHSVLEPSPGSGSSIFDAESPALLAGGTKLAFLREMNGRKQLFVRDLVIRGERTSNSRRQLLPGISKRLLVRPAGRLLFRRHVTEESPRLYRVRGVDQLELIPVGEARYPAISPDGRWLAFSGFQSGTGIFSCGSLVRARCSRLTTAACNQIRRVDGGLQDAVYSSDCGRALWFTLFASGGRFVGRVSFSGFSRPAGLIYRDGLTQIRPGLLQTSLRDFCTSGSVDRFGMTE